LHDCASSLPRRLPLRSAGDDSAGIESESGSGARLSYGGRHGQPRVGLHRSAVAGTGMGSVGLGRDGPERDRRDVRLLGLPHRHCGRRITGRHLTSELARAGADGCRPYRCPEGTRHQDLGRRAARAAPRAGALTGLAVLLTATMSLIQDDPRCLWLGLVLLACTAGCSGLAASRTNSRISGSSAARRSRAAVSPG
jgi:hypothetical protein